MASDTTYTAESVQIYTDCEHIRERPGMYVGDTGERGLFNLLLIVLENSLEESQAGFGRRIKVELLADGGYRVSDEGRGIPIHIVEPTKQRFLELVCTT